MKLLGRLKKPDPEREQKLRNDIEKEGGLEKKDMPAMILSAWLAIVPVCALVLVGIALLALLAFRAI